MNPLPGDLPDDYPEDHEYWSYFAPAIRCKYSPYACREIPLPFPTLPEELEYPYPWPDAEWRAVFVCIDCGHVLEYAAGDVAWERLRKKSKAQFRNETNCFFVKLECAQKGCVIPVEFHVEIFDRAEDDLKREIQKGFVGRWPCGHSALAAPGKAPTIQRIYQGPI